MGDPFVSVLTLNRNGRAGLEGCLRALRNQDYRPDRFEILIVNNGSADDSIPFLRKKFPSVKVLSRHGSLGQIASLQSLLPQARGDYLAFVDHGVRVETTWLRELVGATAREGVTAAASKILDRDGHRIDSAGEIVSLLGHTWPIARGEPPARHIEANPLLFASAAAMLVERSAYDAAGGFDPDYLAGGEDLDLGWRLSLLGYRTVLAPGSLAYRQPQEQGSDRSANAPRVRLNERNALYTIYKCYGEDLLHRVLPVAIALTLARALHHSDLNAADLAPGKSPPETARVSRHTIATLMALQDFAHHLERLRVKRESIQSRRRVSDEALLPLFVEPLKLHELGPPYQNIASELYDEFQLSSLDSRQGTPFADLPGAQLEESRPTWAHAVESHPSVAIIIPTLLAATHLPECLSSLRDLSYPKDKLQVIVVDNGSKEDPTPAVRQHYPAARLIRLSENRGFAGGIAAGVREAEADWLAFLNDDTRVDAAWLEEMLATAVRRRAPCVAARVLNWTGDRIDFAGGGLSFEGKGFQLGHGSTRIHSWAEERPVLFACGAAMMVRRELFLETGGFDEDMFAYYEDVAFGWQLAIRGHDVWLSPRAVVYHKHQGTAGLWASPLRMRLYERNALRTVFTHVEPRNLGRVLPAALLLVNERILLAAGFVRREAGDAIALGSFMRRAFQRARRHDGFLAGIKSLLAASRSAAGPNTKGGRCTSAYRMAGALEERPVKDGEEILPTTAAAGLIALHDWLESLPAQRRRRREIQRNRRRSDTEILSAFPARWTQPVGAEPRTQYLRVHEAVVQAFSLGDMARPPRQ